MPVAEIFRVNYFVGAMLAQGGNLWLEESQIVFSPTSAIDRAMGARNVEIPLQSIRGVSYAGSLSRSFNIKTDDKVHKFEGGQARKFWELLEKALVNKGITASLEVAHKNTAPTEKPASTFVCDQCVKPVQPGYSFCPYCAARIKSVCSSCHRSIDPTWAACAFCGWKFAPTPQQHP